MKIRVYPEPALHKIWKCWLSVSRYCYNKAIAALKAGDKIKSAYSLRDYVVGLELPEWVKTAPSHLKENAIFDAWDGWLQAKAAGGEAGFRSCRQPSQAIKFHKVNFNGRTWLPSLVKGLTFRASEAIPTQVEFATQLVRDRKRWFACIPIVEEAESKELDKVIALDPGVRTFLTGFDGDSFQEFGKADIGRIQRLCSHLDKLIGRISKATRRLRSCTYPYNPGFSQKQRNKATVFFLAFLGKIRTLGLVLCVNFTSIFIGARCEKTKTPDD